MKKPESCDEENMSYYIDPEVYKKYKKQILEMSQSVQINYAENIPPEKRMPGFSDEQIGEKLGLDSNVVREIRCVAERDFYTLDSLKQSLRLQCLA